MEEEYTYEQFENQQNEIAQEQNKKPLVGQKVPSAPILQSYNTGNEVVQQKVKRITESYKSMREVRGDGSCFYRAFTFALLEHLLFMENDIAGKAEKGRIYKIVKDSLSVLVKLGYAEYLIEDFHSCLLELFQFVIDTKNPAKDLEVLEKNFNDEVLSNTAVGYMRFICSSHLQSKDEQYSYSLFLTSQPTIREFCAKETEVSTREAEDMNIIALTREFGVGVQLEYLDANQSQHSVKFPDEENVKTGIYMLYRPGHYDLLYK